MKQARSAQTINTCPDGAYECSIQKENNDSSIPKQHKKGASNVASSKSDITTDLQGNGYPKHK